MKYLIIIISLLACINQIKAEDTESFNTHRHLAFTYSVNFKAEQKVGLSIFTINPKGVGIYINTKKGYKNYNREYTITTLNLSATHKLNSFIAGYAGVGYTEDITEDSTKAINKYAQINAGLIINPVHGIYIEAGYESYTNSMSFGIGYKAFITDMR